MNAEQLFNTIVSIATFGLVDTEGRTEWVAIGDPRDVATIKLLLEAGGLKPLFTLGTTDGGVSVRPEDLDKAERILKSRG